jgi:hypothetical protein
MDIGCGPIHLMIVFLTLKGFNISIKKTNPGSYDPGGVEY